MKEPECVCGCWLVEKDGWQVCPACGGATTKSGKYLPPHSGWDIPPLDNDEIQAACDARERDEDVAAFWRIAFG